MPVLLPYLGEDRWTLDWTTVRLIRLQVRKIEGTKADQFASFPLSFGSGEGMVEILCCLPYHNLFCSCSVSLASVPALACPVTGSRKGRRRAQVSLSFYFPCSPYGYISPCQKTSPNTPYHQHHVHEPKTRLLKRAANPYFCRARDSETARPS
jgi:hypothetical protein